MFSGLYAATTSASCHVTIVFVTVFVVTVLQMATGDLVFNSTIINVTLVDPNAGSQLEVVQVSPTSGYIQTTGWDRTTHHPKNMDSMVRVEIPENYQAIISIVHLNLTGLRQKCTLSKVKLDVYHTDPSGVNRIYFCTKIPVRRQELPAGSDIFVHFQSWTSQMPGFRFFFSVHEESTMMRTVESIAGPNDMWNCSASTFDEYKPHFPCDLIPQCVNMIDERDCPYFSEACGLGYVTVGDQCLFYDYVKDYASWREIEYLCEKRGGRLANLRSYEDHQTFIKYLEPSLDTWIFWKVVVGLHTTSSSLPRMYTNEVQHSDGTIAFYRAADNIKSIPNACGSINLQPQDLSYLNFIRLTYCSSISRGHHYLCETANRIGDEGLSGKKKKKIEILPLSSFSHTSTLSPVSLVQCPLGHATRDFLACDAKTNCWSRDGNECRAPLTPLPPSYACANGGERVPYTLVCDLRPDCSDGSDESFCVFPPCDLQDPFHCSKQQCVHREKVCDGQVDCYNQEDEDLCSTSMGRSYVSPSPPAIVELLRSGEFNITKMNDSQPGALGSASCPETHFQCPGDGYCMPGYVRCNGVSDCLGEEDEADCNTYTCPGYYRCRGSRSCLHPHYLCDGIYHCPQHDDELMCDLDCPQGCTCYGQAFFCRRPFAARSFPRIRFLDGRASGIRILDLKENILLIHLNLAENWLTSAEGPTFPNLRTLDLSDNQMKGFYVYDLGRLPQLETLVLSGNPLVYLFQSGKRHAVVNVIFPWTSTPQTILTTAYQNGSFTSEEIDTTEYLNDLNDSSTDENSTSERRHTMSLSTEYQNDKFKITGMDITAYTSTGVDNTAYTSAVVDTTAYTSAGVDTTAYTSPGDDTTAYTSAGDDTTAYTSPGVDTMAYKSTGVDTAAYTLTGVDTTTHTSAGVDNAAYPSAGVDTTAYTSTGVDTTTHTSTGVDTAVYQNGSRTNENSTSDPVSTPGLQTGLYSTEWASVSAPANSSEVNETSSDESEELGIMPSLKSLDLSRVKIEVLDVSFFSLLPDLQILNLSGSEVDSIVGDGFNALTLLHTLDIRGCPLTHFPPDMLSGLQNLQTVVSDNFKLCCPALLPIGFNLQNCFAPTDEISSCESLLRSNVYRTFLSIFAAMALLGNSASFIYRVFLQKKKRLLSFDVFVAHLCVGDFLMGVYLMVIGVADRLYQGTYLWEDNTWKSSAACKMAGFLSLMSSEVSAMVIVLITVDRFLVLRFPFSRLHFDSRSAQIACLGVWAVGFMVAAVPLVPALEHWKFYGQSGICIPLPVTRSDFPGHTYAFGVMIIANFVLFIIIAAGQVVIYWSIHSNTMSSGETTRKSHDITIARRLITVAMSDFLCWFPIGLLGLLAATGTPIPGEVNVAMAIFVLPFNSALNPFLYTLNLVLEKRRKAEEERIKKRLMSQFKSMVSDDKTMSSQFNH